MVSLCIPISIDKMQLCSLSVAYYMPAHTITPQPPWGNVDMFNQLLDKPHLSGGWIILAKEKCSLTGLTAIDKVLQIVHQLQATQPPSHKVHLPLAEGFLLQCDLHLAHLAGTASVRDKVALLISVLTDRALEWAHAIWERDSPEVQSYECFTQLVHAPFLLPVTFPDYPGTPLCPALVDSGSAGNFLGRSVALSLCIPLVPLQPPYPSPCPRQPSPRNRTGVPVHDSHFPHSCSQPP
uniref:DUF4939 domain-containing protein n=1 Tax=Oncorhynchus kisutch TaxID=8019 RepID=A0A8C7F189_ONCKI